MGMVLGLIGCLYCGNTTGSYGRVLGGDWPNSDVSCKSAYRSSIEPAYRTDRVSFRVLRRPWSSRGFKGGRRGAPSMKEESDRARDHPEGKPEAVRRMGVPDGCPCANRMASGVPRYSAVREFLSSPFPVVLLPDGRAEAGEGDVFLSLAAKACLPRAGRPIVYP